MKIRFIFTIMVISAMITGCGTGDQNDAPQWYNYGDSITDAEVLGVSKAVEKLDELAGQPVLVEGVIKQVCQNRGCWMVVEEGEKSVRVRFADYGFFVPWESAGKTVRMQGTIYKETVSEETARHWAEEAGDPAVKPEDIHGDQEVIMIMATAVSIEDGTPLSEEQTLVTGGADGHDHTH